MKKKLICLVLVLINPLFISNIFCQREYFSEIFISPSPASESNAIGYMFQSGSLIDRNISFGIQARKGYPITFLLYNGQNTMRALSIQRGQNQDITLYFPTENKWNRFTTSIGGAFTFSTNGRGNVNGEIDLIITPEGNVGIGNKSEISHKLEVIGTGIFHFPQTHIEMKQGRNYNPILNFSNSTWNRINAVGDLALFTNNQGDISDIPQLLIVKGGQVCIGGILDGISQANLNKYKLFVNKGILSEDFAIGPRASWADHVFKADYKLMELEEVESYITENNKLPDIPSAAEVQENGYSLHEMNIKLLQKIEELTLYVIGQGKEIEKLKKSIGEL